MARPGDAGDLAMKRPVWFWVAMAYLVATVAYNLWLQGKSSIYFPQESLGVIANLSSKIIAIVLLFCRRGEGVYFLALAFVVGLWGTITGEFQYWTIWLALPLVMKIGRINGFLISFAIIIYMSVLKRHGVLKSSV
jgi:hypothetical protein